MLQRQHRLKLARGVVYAERGGRHLFLQPAAPDWMVVNENAAILLSRCAASTLEEVIAPGEELLREPARALFAEALARQVLEDVEDGDAAVPRPPADPRQDRPPGEAECQAAGRMQGLAAGETQHLAAVPGGREGSMGFPAAAAPSQPLQVVHLKLTNRCNLRCAYCYAESGAGPHESLTDSTGDGLGEGMLTRQELDAIAASVARMGRPVEYVLSGGEPLFHPYALEFAQKVKAAGNKVHLLTNGTLIDARNAERIAAVTDLVKISLDGSCEQTHAATRGGGNFARAQRAVGLLEEYGARTVVAMTVTRENRSEIDVMVARHGSRLSLQPLFRAGRGSALDRSALSGQEYYRTLTEARGVAPMGDVGQRLRGLRGRGVRRCSMAEREISINESGDVFPCQLLHGEAFRAGNIREQPLEEIYSRSPVFERLRRVSVDTLDKCAVCALRYLCGGACRARDLYETGSIETVGEFCAYEREALLNGLFDSVQMRAV